MNKTKDIQKKRIIYIGETVFCLLIAVLWLFSLSQGILNKVDWADAIKDFIWLIIFGIATWYNFHQAKTIGTTKFEDDVDDERDQYIEMKTNTSMKTIKEVKSYPLENINRILKSLMGGGAILVPGSLRD